MFKTTLQSFDKTTFNDCRYRRPEKYIDLFDLPEGPVIARGAGLSYCNAAACENGTIIDFSLFNRVLGFDGENGFITIEAGMTMGDLNNFVIGHSWQLPVLPGYPLITVGGCIAFNIHGKSQYKIGLFGEWVKELTLFHPVHGEIICSNLENPELFDLTIGGMGFTGIILSAKLRLKRIEGNQMEIKSISVDNLRDAVKVMGDNIEEYEYIYSWNNFNLKGKRFGKGIVYLEKIRPGFSGDPKPVLFHNRLVHSINIPSLLNRFTINWMCKLYYAINSLSPTVKYQNLSAASFPIYGKEIYYYLFGRRGFREYQVIFPPMVWVEAIDEIRGLIYDAKIGISLASLKIFKGEPRNLCFSGEGLCIAIDIPNNYKSVNFLDRLDAITIKYNGRINLSKDSRAGAELVRSLFPEYEEFKRRIQEYDPKKVFFSELRKRLEI